MDLAVTDAAAVGVAWGVVAALARQLAYQLSAVHLVRGVEEQAQGELAVEDDMFQRLPTRSVGIAGSDGLEEGPVFLELKTYRFRAHSMYDAELYRSKEEVERWKERDPIPTFTAKLRGEGTLADADWSEIERTVAAEVAEAVAFAEAGPWEPVEDLLKDVHTPVTP